MLNLDAIKSRREKLGLTQDQAATKAGLGSRQRWNDIESGRKPNISMDTFDAIATALQCDPCDLLAKEAKGKVKISLSMTSNLQSAIRKATIASKKGRQSV